MRSSYIQNKYHEVFAAIIAGFKPKVCIELGVLDGYSTLAIARALKKNNNGATLTSYDLFEEYPYKHGDQAEVQHLIDENCVEDVVTLRKQDAFTVAGMYEDNTIDMLHVDVSNTGDTVKVIIEQWDKKMVCNGHILIEGGTVERDNIDWMKTYNAPSIKAELESNPIIKEKYIFATYLPFPGLTHLLKKR